MGASSSNSGDQLVCSMQYVPIIQLISMCTHLLTIIKIPEAILSQLWSQITYGIVNIFGKIILLALLSDSELMKEMVLAVEEKLPLVCQV